MNEKLNGGLVGVIVVLMILVGVLFNSFSNTIIRLDEKLKDEQEYSSGLLETIHDWGDPKPNFFKCINTWNLAPKDRLVCPDVEDNYQEGYDKGYEVCNQGYLQNNN